jgi:hypothetical protein
MSFYREYSTRQMQGDPPAIERCSVLAQLV